MKRILLAEVGKFCAHDKVRWKQPVLRTIDELRENAIPAVFFGGTLRSLLVSRLSDGKPGRPRDVDLVVRGVTTAILRAKFERHMARETRFGGLQLQRGH